MRKYTHVKTIYRNKHFSLAMHNRFNTLRYRKQAKQPFGLQQNFMAC